MNTHLQSTYVSQVRIVSYERKTSTICKLGTAYMWSKPGWV